MLSKTGKSLRKFTESSPINQEIDSHSLFGNRCAHYQRDWINSSSFDLSSGDMSKNEMPIS
jgi:hypothetical protein